MEDRQVGWSSRMTLDLRVSTRVQTHLVGGLRRAVGRLPETGAGRPSLDRQREMHD